MCPHPLLSLRGVTYWKAPFFNDMCRLILKRIGPNWLNFFVETLFLCLRESAERADIGSRFALLRRIAKRAELAKDPTEAWNDQFVDG